MTNKTKDRILSGASKVGLTLTAWGLRFLLLVLYGRGKYRSFKWWSIKLEARIPGTRHSVLDSPTPASDARIAEESKAVARMMKEGSNGLYLTSGELLDDLARESGVPKAVIDATAVKNSYD